MGIPLELAVVDITAAAAVMVVGAKSNKDGRIDDCEHGRFGKICKIWVADIPLVTSLLSCGLVIRLKISPQSYQAFTVGPVPVDFLHIHCF
jgi:hypothetical protein